MQGDGSLFPTERRDTPAPRRYLRVAIERGMDANWAAGDEAGLTYATDDEQVSTGSAVTVPLGRGDTPVRGIVVASGGPELLDGLAPARVKHARALPDPPLPRALIELGVWMSGYYVCPIGMTLSSMVPAAVKKQTGAGSEVRVQLARDAEHRAASIRLSPSAKAAWESLTALDSSPMPCTAGALKRALGLRSVAAINRLVKAGLLVTEAARTVRSREIESLTSEASPAAVPEPTDEQAVVVEGITPSLGSFSTHLLKGVTGSGKTEVYIRLVERTLELGRAAIVLVPEIALTPQASARYAARLGRDRVVVLHSGLTSSQRHAGWQRLSSGEASVVVGARSAVFAPVQRLGLIVVDEEHDASFKQDQLPRYHGRDVAIKRAQIENAAVVLGSATPSLESYHNALAARYALWKMDRRVGAAELPDVRVVDMRRRSDAPAHADRSPPELVGPDLARATLETVDDGGQCILLLNRRGFGRRIGCLDRRCGWVQACDHCDANLVWHRASQLPMGGTMRCHHCLAEQRLVTRCPSCSGPVRALDAGTQRLEVELAEWLGLVPGESLLRLDADVASISGAMVSVLDRFARGEAPVLLGTQMVAKGLDFANVRLVGVLDADQSLTIPDFRAAERTFQLVAQVAGRAGRGQHAGRVIVQTHEPRAEAILCAAKHDFEGFARSELAARRSAGLPPATRMVRLIARDRDHAEAQAAAQAIAEAVRDHDSEGRLEVMGPMPCVIGRIADHFRFAVELLSARAADLQRVLAACRAEGLIKSDRRTAVDVDPVSLL